MTNTESLLIALRRIEDHAYCSFWIETAETHLKSTPDQAVQNLSAALHDFYVRKIECEMPLADIWHMLARSALARVEWQVEAIYWLERAATSIGRTWPVT